MATIFVNQLTNVDFSYLDTQRGLVGETWLVDIMLSGELDIQGMVLDFGILKPLLKRQIEQEIDHKLLVPATSPRIKWENTMEGPKVTMTDMMGHVWQHMSPAEAVCRVEAEFIGIPQVTRHLQSVLQTHMQQGLTVQVQLRAEQLEGAFYHYSHGLKKHNGNCQRIAHGHRSPLRILVEGKRQQELEANWAKAWTDIYVGTREDIAARTENEGQNYLRFDYHSQQGHFQLTIPENRCYIMDEDTTVEYIAQHIAEQTAQTQPGKQVQVIAFEGYQKGAIGLAKSAGS